MTNSTQDTARDRARAALTAGIREWFTRTADETDARKMYLAIDRTADETGARKMYLAIDEVLNYTERCEESGITMHPADVRRLIASALGVSSS